MEAVHVGYGTLASCSYTFCMGCPTEMEAIVKDMEWNFWLEPLEDECIALTGMGFLVMGAVENHLGD